MGDMVARRCQMGTNIRRCLSLSIFDIVLTGNGDKAGLTRPPSAYRSEDESLNEANFCSKLPFFPLLPRSSLAAPALPSPSVHLEFIPFQRGPQQQQKLAGSSLPAVDWDRVKRDTPLHLDCFRSTLAKRHRRRPRGVNQHLPEPSSPSLCRSSVGGESLNKLWSSPFSIPRRQSPTLTEPTPSTPPPKSQYPHSDLSNTRSSIPKFYRKHKTQRPGFHC
ncbi:hypothetical protein M758_4G077300 [Ceratodon purpureus]|nr:hypothetical protein M758_4G077300 [Ceratodon purpureus]